MYKKAQLAELVPRSADLEAYMDWGLSKGVRLNKITYPARFFPGYFGTIATEHISPGEVLISIPNNLLLTSKVAETSDLSEVFREYDKFFDEDDIHYEDLVLITYLIWEKYQGERSKWYLFLKNQPALADTLQDWSIEELQQLQDPDVVYDVKQQMGGNLKLWNAWKKVMLKSKLFTGAMTEFSEYTWANRLLSTRSFGKFCPFTTFAPIAEFFNHHNTFTYYYYGTHEASVESAKRYVNFTNGEDHDDDLIYKKPIFELSCDKILKLNKLKDVSRDSGLFKLVKEAESIDNEEKVDKDYGKPDSELLRESDDKQLCIITGNEEYEAGAEVYMSYGRYSNRMLLSTYGFALKDNIYDFCRIKISLDKLCRGEKAYEVKVNDKGRLYVFKLKYNTLCKGKKYLEILRAIRAFNWEESINTDAFFSPADAELELKVFEIFESILSEKIASFPTDLEADLKSLASSSSLRHYFAVIPTQLIYRTEVKKIALRQLELINAAKNVLLKIREGFTVENALESCQSINPESTAYTAISNYFRTFKIYNPSSSSS